MSKINYVSPELDVIIFESCDIITTSGGGILDPEEDVWQN